MAFSHAKCNDSSEKFANRKKRNNENDERQVELNGEIAQIEIKKGEFAFETENETSGIDDERDDEMRRNHPHNRIETRREVSLKR